jgi:hypothetical protein
LQTLVSCSWFENILPSTFFVHIMCDKSKESWSLKLIINDFVLQHSLMSYLNDCDRTFVIEHLK